MSKHIWFWFITQCWAMKDQAILWKCLVRHNITFAGLMHKVCRWRHGPHFRTLSLLHQYGWLKMHLPGAIRTQIPCAAPNFHSSLYLFHKKRSTLFFHLKVTKFILFLLSNNKSTWYWIFDKLYHTHITKTTIETLLYQPLRFIITLIQCTSKRNMISYVDDWTNRSMANTICIYTFIKFMCTF